MIDFAFGPREYAARLPTTDLYFLRVLRSRRMRMALQGSSPPVSALDRNVYLVGRTCVVSRFAAMSALDRIRALRPRKLVYIADDDFEAGAADAALPDAYRRKLATFVGDAWPALRSAADIVVVPNRVLAQVYGSKSRIIQPIWPVPAAAHRHFDAAARFDIAFLGTASHSSDFSPLAALLAGVLDRNPHVRLTLSGAGPAAGLVGRRQVRLLRPMAWWRYKLWLPRQRFHLALYPLADTAFNRARSANKMFEHAAVGAAGLMSPIPALLELAGTGLDRLFVRGGFDEWCERIEEDIANPSGCRRRAEQTRAHIVAADPLGDAVRQWRDILSAAT